MEVKIKYFDKELEKVNFIGGEKSDWYDLRAREDVFAPLSKLTMIPLGVAMQLPEGYEAHVLPRSSTFKKWGIIMVNSMGVIDGSYCGDTDEWQFPALCLDAKDVVDGVQGTMVHKGDRICQFRLMENMEPVHFREVLMLGNVSRGGFGTTGKN